MAGFRHYELGDVPLQSGAVLRDAQARLRDLWHAQSGGGQRGRAADLLYRHPSPQRAAVRRGPRHRSGAALRRVDQPVRQRLFVVAEQRPCPAGRPALSPCHAVRQRRLPAPPAHRALGVKRIALVLGWSMAAMQAYQWAAQYPEHGQGDPALLRRGPLLPPQLRVPRRPEGGAAGGRAWNGGDYATPPEKGLESVRPRLCRLGLLPRFLRQTASIASSASPPWRTSCATGRRITSTGTPMISSPRSGPGSTATSATTPSMAAISPALCSRSPRARSSCRAAPTCISCPRTTPPKSQHASRRAARRSIRRGAIAWARRDACREFQRALDEAAAELLRG